MRWVSNPCFSGKGTLGSKGGPVLFVFSKADPPAVDKPVDNLWTIFGHRSQLTRLGLTVYFVRLPSRCSLWAGCTFLRPYSTSGHLLTRAAHLDSQDRLLTSDR
jgi:hypothetical protein